MNFYDGGSDKDDIFLAETGNSIPSQVTSTRNQMFITFITDGGVGKGFTANITFSKKGR